MSDSDISNRSLLMRRAIVFQVKLMADGFRDLVLVPISLIAALVGLLRGGSEPEREFNQVIDLGIRSEKWIDLFGQHQVKAPAHNAASIDTLFTHVETVLKEQYKTAGTSPDAQAEIDEALQAVQEEVLGDNERRAGPGPE